VLPRLRTRALSLLRGRDGVDDLVQQTVLKALVGRESFRPGSNFVRWMFLIQRNEFISELRRNRARVRIAGQVSELRSDPPKQDNGLILREFLGAFRQLSRGEREALLLSQLEGQSYPQICRRTTVPVGTLKSRVSRGRATLARLLQPGPLAGSKPL
jgi:RNA polymerase sigma-70 factor (ECF subfamily)